ncbi:unnamed protein product [Fraxinus pennsylvanica]|uniref:Uncharacterized protein n=1 Tax=Fraxinus pennsylvanica TaxID=56036 RepID=A0AAD2DLB3_9LAMI|nr:unnamed protein product [Fraxinus pennsylvanica]
MSGFGLNPEIGRSVADVVAWEDFIKDMDCVVYLSPVVGTKGGTLEIIDVRNGTCMEVVEARGGSVQPIAATADGFVTGIADHDVKFWEYQTTQKPGQDSKRLAVSPVRNLRMNDDVLVVAVSQKGKSEFGKWRTKLFQDMMRWRLSLAMMLPPEIVQYLDSTISPQ